MNKEEIDKLKETLKEYVDYAIKLVKENKRLQQESKDLKEDRKFLFEENHNKEQVIIKQNEKIDKAIELLEYVNKTKEKIGYNENEKDYLDSLEEILRGEDKENE